MEINLVILYAAISVVTLIVYLLWKQLSYWKDRGIPQSEPQCLYGNFKDVGRTRHMSEPFDEAYRAFKGKAPFAGVYMMWNPVAVITDLDLVKNILIKDFQNFVDRGTFFNERDDPLSAHLVNLDGDKWRKMRQKLSPTFTSGKMKFMFPTVVNVANEFIETFESLVKQNENVEIKDIVARYTIDVIGTCAFGIQCNSLKDPNTQFRLMGNDAIFKRKHSTIVDNFISSFPKFARFLRMRRIPTDVHNFFMGIVRETVDYRERNNILRNDFMNLLIDLKNNKDKDGDGLLGLSIEEVAAQAFVFFLAGFETSASTIGFCLYELAQNQDIQDRLRKEIVDTLAKHNNELTYECIKGMNYLQMVLSETLRKYSVFPFLLRLATTDYQVPDSNFTIEKGTRIFIPVSAIQHDPEIYPNPEVFDPHRFSPEEVQKRHPAAWLPFGDGPRNCIGLRFGKMQANIGLVFLLKSFQFSVCPQTDIPLKYGKKSVIIYHEGGIVLKVEKI